MASEELVARLGLDTSNFRRGLAESERWADKAQRDIDARWRAVEQRQAEDARKRSAALATGWRLAGVAAVAAVGSLSVAMSEYAKRSEEAAGGINRVKKSWGDLAAAVGRDIAGGNKLLGRIAGVPDHINGLRSEIVDRLAAEGKLLHGQYPRTPTGYAAALADTRGQTTELLAQEDLERQRRAMLAARDERARLATGRAGDEARILQESRAGLLRVQSDENLSPADKLSLAEAIKARRDEQFARLDRATYGSMDASIFGQQGEVAKLRIQAASTRDDAERTRIELRLADAMERLAVLMGTRDALDNTGLSDPQATEQIRRARIEASRERAETLAGIAARDRERVERARIVAEERAAGARTFTRDRLIEDRIGILGANGNSAEARRMMLGLSYVQSEEAIKARTDLTDEQRAALLASNRSLFEAEYAATAVTRGSGPRVLGAGSGALLGQVFSGTGVADQQLDVQKSMAETLKTISGNVADMAANSTVAWG